MQPWIQVLTSYAQGGWCILKRTSNYIFYQVEELIQGDLGYLVQGFGGFPTQISKFLGLGEVYGSTDPGRDQLWTWGLRHIKEHSKLHILSSGGVNPEGSWLFVAGVWEFPHTNFEIFGFGGSKCAHASTQRLALNWYCLGERMGVRRRVSLVSRPPFHTDSNELLFVSMALTLTEILVNCDCA